MEYTPDNEEPLQRTEPVPYSKPPAPAVSSPPSAAKSGPQSSPKDSGFVVQLSEKIRQQAKIMEGQETYKILCEKRILELCPSHPLPVLPSHLGKTMGTPTKSSGRSASPGPSSQELSELRKVLLQRDQELHFMKQRCDKLISELEQTRASLGSGSARAGRGRAMTTSAGKSMSPERGPSDSEQDMGLANRLAQLQKEKQTLEETLRAEILANEEQRNYTQILKEALETKIEDLGFSDILNQARAGNQTVQAVDIFAELAAVKKGADQSRREQTKCESVARELEGQLIAAKQRLVTTEQENGDLQKKVTAFQEDLNNSLKALEQTRAAAAKLEEEKNSLLDYVEELTEKHDQLASNLESLNTLHKKVSEEKLAGDKHIEELEKGVKNVETTFKQEMERRDERLESYRQQVDKYKEQRS